MHPAETQFCVDIYGQYIYSRHTQIPEKGDKTREMNDGLKSRRTGRVSICNACCSALQRSPLLGSPCQILGGCPAWGPRGGSCCCCCCCGDSPSARACIGPPGVYLSFRCCSRIGMIEISVSSKWTELGVTLDTGVHICVFAESSSVKVKVVPREAGQEDGEDIGRTREEDSYWNLQICEEGLVLPVLLILCSHPNTGKQWWILIWVTVF